MAILAVLAAGTEELEERIRQALAEGDTESAARALMRGFGPEILSWLHAVLDERTEADEVFAAFAEAMWRGLPRFRAESSVRTWSYAVARNCLMDAFRRQARDRLAPVGIGPWTDAAQQVRTTTPPWIKTEVKDAFRVLRSSLPVEDRMLLVLRVDRELEWTQIAAVFAGPDEARPDVLRRRAAALRKRFERLKAELRERAREAGLL